MDEYYEKHICGLISKVIKLNLNLNLNLNASKIIYDNEEKHVLYIRFNENYYDLNEDDKYNVQCYLEKKYCDLIKIKNLY